MEKIDKIVRVIAVVFSSFISAMLLSLFSTWGMSHLDPDVQETVARAISPSAYRAEMAPKIVPTEPLNVVDRVAPSEGPSAAVAAR